MTNQRYEIKFILNESERLEAFYFLKQIGAYSPYPSRSINSLYFDTVDYKGVRENLAGISYRHKIRLRWYDENNEQRIPELEIKSREGRLGNKNKYKLTSLLYDDVHNFTATEISKYIFQYIYKNYGYDDRLNNHYIPVLLVNYFREYLETDRGIRITIDKSISFRDISQGKNITYHNSIPYNEYIMELKFPIHMKDEVAHTIRPLHLTPKRHSKYLTGMAKLGYVTYI